MTERSNRAARQAGASMGRAYVDQLLVLPDAVAKIRLALRTKTLKELGDQIVADTVNHPQLRAMYRKEELQHLSEGFLETALARIDEFVKSG